MKNEKNHFKCPFCGKIIDDSFLKKYTASLSGKRSKRKLTPKQAKKMLLSRKKKLGY